MWNHLAAKVGTQDWSGTLQKIGNAVAPPPGEDDDYEDDDGSYDDDYEVEDDRPAFGFVGMLARALDKTNEEYEEEEAEPEKGKNQSKASTVAIPEEALTLPYVAGYSTPTSPHLPPPDSNDFRKEELDAQPPYQSTKKSDIDTVRLLLPPKPLLRDSDSTLPHVACNGTRAPPNDAQAPRSETQQEIVHNLVAFRNEQGDAEILKRSPDAHDASSSCWQAAGDPSSSTCGRQALEIEKFATGEPPIPKMEANDHDLPTLLAPALVQTVALVPSVHSGQPTSLSDSDWKAMLQQAEERIFQLQKLLTEQSERFAQLRENLLLEFQQKEARLMEATTEEYQHELAQAKHQYHSEIQALEMRTATEKKDFLENQERLHKLVEESNAQAERAKMLLEKVTQQHNSTVVQVAQQEQRSLRMAEEKVAQTMALLDERDDLISTLKQKIKILESKMNDREKGVEEAEQEVEELQIENEELHDKNDHLQDECSKLREKVAILENEATQLGPLQMELTMLREERDRERAKNQSVVKSTMTSHSQVESERDCAIAEVRDLKQQLAAVIADLEISRTDRERLLTANHNLQSALEAFQDERQAEIKILEEQRLESEVAINAAHAEAVEIIKHTHCEDIRRVELLAEDNLRKVMEQRDEVKLTLKKLQAENIQTRRSLDEAIHRLQTTQEDVIDRTLMKNILLDWCIMKNKEKRHQVLELMANVLHFTDEEKESVHLTHLDIDSVRSKVVGAIAAPLPPSKASLEQLQGENVSEKWISFLMAETDDDF